MRLSDLVNVKGSSEWPAQSKCCISGSHYCCGFFFFFFNHLRCAHSSAKCWEYKAGGLYLQSSIPLRDKINHK
jgi:hypothetical protein